MNRLLTFLFIVQFVFPIMAKPKEQEPPEQWFWSVNAGYIIGTALLTGCAAYLLGKHIGEQRGRALLQQEYFKANTFLSRTNAAILFGDLKGATFSEKLISFGKFHFRQGENKAVQDLIKSIRP